MSNNNGLSKYKQTAVTTASRGQVLLMLYESSIKYTKQAIEAVKVNNRPEKGRCIGKIQDIINELSLSLNHDVGGNISKDLDRLYNFIVEQITEANIKNDAKPLEATLKILETLYEGWTIAVQQVATKYAGDPTLAAAVEMNQKAAGTDQDKK